ncbi:hypothetical protein PL8927_510009 [Planktothrix serta PCC 8927]|uniref:Uncharacterized protein n=1 Tax=Planktothrix serta PCC 8927 TaxID=671068 RepID=A0A7Z9DX24_9CYAN|nr:hypothetical protein [Planktothrix serta]VXD15975.1 hypothetical protein PL8927_510009 [Planktothrix serta PCC 8927]
MTQSDDGESIVQAILAKIGYHRYRLNITQSQMAELLNTRFKKSTVSSLNRQQLTDFLTEIETVISIEELQF